MTLPAFAAERRRLQHGARSYRPMSAAATDPLLLSIDGRANRLTDTVPLHRSSPHTRRAVPTKHMDESLTLGDDVLFVVGDLGGCDSLPGQCLGRRQQLGVHVHGSTVDAVTVVEPLSHVARRPVVVLLVVPRLELRRVPTPGQLAVCRHRRLHVHRLTD